MFSFFSQPELSRLPVREVKSHKGEESNMEAELGIFRCVGECQMRIHLDCNCPTFDGLRVGKGWEVAPRHEGCTCYIEENDQKTISSIPLDIARKIAAAEEQIVLQGSKTTRTPTGIFPGLKDIVAVTCVFLGS